MSIGERWDDWLGGLQDRYGHRRIRMLALLIIAAMAALAIQLLISYRIDSTAILYLAVPYCTAVLITLLRPYGEDDSWWMPFVSHSVSALVVFLGSSVILGEGFICVLFFMPIYFFMVTLAFIASWISVNRTARKGKTYAIAIPLLVAALSFEGTTEVTTFDRKNSVTATVTTTLLPEELLQNLATPFDLADSDNWVLRLFPMPQAIEAGSLDIGDVHRVHFRYDRWLVANTHEGTIELRLDSVTPDGVSISFTSDTSFFASYVKLIGSDIQFTTNDVGLTDVSLTVRYERRLDPVWYFKPMQQYTIRKMAAHLIEEIMIRD